MRRKAHNRVTRTVIAGAAVFLLGGPFAFAQSADTTALINRINQLENQLQTLSRHVFRGDVPSSSRAQVAAPASSDSFSGGGSDPATADILVRLSQLENQLREMTGRLEEREYEVSQLAARQDKALQDIEMRLGTLEGGGQAPAMPPAESSNAVPPDQVLGEMPAENPSFPPAVTEIPENVRATPEGLYEYGFTLLRQGDYPAAEKAFADFLSRYSDHALAGNSQYWLAETFYVRNDMNKAARLFAEGYQKYPKSSKAADNLLKLAISLSRLNKTQDACLTLGQLRKEFPDEKGPVAVRADQERTRIGCP